MNYICQLCGYLYNVNKGDPDNGIDPETEFEDLGANWTCPLCAAGKEDFEEVDDSEEYQSDEE